jgi:hypothetical protein
MPERPWGNAVFILDKLRLRGHLDDAALAAIWTDAAAGGVQPSHPHLQACSGCRSRFTSFASWLTELRTDAAAEVDELFPPERLAAQHAQIFRRLEASERPARVIKFPKFAQPLTSRASHGSRWIAAAAAAGLIVGVGVGQMMDIRRSLSGPAAPATQARLNLRPNNTEVRTVGANGREEAFLSEVDVTLSRPALPELRALDEFTPRAGERGR